MRKRLLSCLTGWFAGVLLLTLTGACEEEVYETGDGELSYMQADFALVYSDHNRDLVRARTDEGTELRFEEPVMYDWVATADSMYRGLVYYNNKVKDGSVEVIGVTQVLCASPKKPSDFKEIHTDPLLLESAWLSCNSSFLNLGMYIKTGIPDQVDTRQSVGIVGDTVVAHANGHKNIHLTLYHHQNGVPEYYSARLWMTVWLSDVQKDDTVTLQANSYDGLLERRLVAE